MDFRIFEDRCVLKADYEDRRNEGERLYVLVYSRGCYFGNHSLAAEEKVCGKGKVLDSCAGCHGELSFGGGFGANGSDGWRRRADCEK